MVKAIPTPLRIAAWVFVGLAAVFLLGPLVVVIGVSLSESRFISFPPNGLSLQWYRQVLSSDAYLAAGWLSFQVAVLVTISATLIGGAAAVAIHRRKLPGAEAMGAFSCRRWCCRRSSMPSAC